jgi:hypothetical protein
MASRIGHAMAQPGRDASSPWDESPETSSEPAAASPPAPIVLGGAEGMTINTEMQNQMPTQLAPAAGTTLTGSVGTIDSDVWEVQQGAKTVGSFWKGMGITCMFGFAIIFVPMTLMFWSESQWDDDWHDEQINVQWDVAGLNGTFQVEHAPVQECELNFYESGNRWNYEGGAFEAWADCDGRITSNVFEVFVEYQGGAGSEGNFTVTVDGVYSAGENVTLSVAGWNEQTNRYQELVFPTQALDANSSQLVFATNETDWPRCELEVSVKGESLPYWTHYWTRNAQWGYQPSNCPDASYGEDVNYVVGIFDSETGQGELTLNEPLDEGVVLMAEYSEEWDGGGDWINDIAPCLGMLLGLVLFGFWIQRIVVNFQAGMSQTGTGMLVGIVPAFVLSFIVAIIIEILFWW